ncbi:restriction endonuclease subunit S [Bacillus wiedmannii]|uniref:restriction endonuclease subunit S n=1 Tax=Bacillus wiedmannii TaxID=1890302 RepID=UPI002E1CD383|nr:restriction endonuclease subunit S [Bacillus wiedmannii]
MSLLLEQFDTIFDSPEFVQKLQELILGMAVRGKLVPQDKNDEPVSVLLEKVKEVKERLIKEKKIKKEKPLPPITEEEKPYELPRGWQWVRLGLATVYGNNKQIKPEDITEDMWVLELEDIEKDTSRILRKIKNKERKVSSNKNTFYENNILYGKLRPYLNKVVVVDDVGVCSSEIIPIDTLGYLNSRYLMYYLKSPYFVKRVNSLTYGTKMPRLGTEDARKTLVPVPPFNEQKRIVEKIDKLMGYCKELRERLEKRQRRVDRLNIAAFSSIEQSATKEELQENLQFILCNLQTLCRETKHIQQLKNTILSLGVKGKLVPQAKNDIPASVLLEKTREEKEQLIKEEKIKKEKPLSQITDEEKSFELPNGWGIVGIEQLINSKGDIRTGPFGSMLSKSEHQLTGIPVWGIESIGKNGVFTYSNKIFISEMKAKALESFSVEAGDIIISRSGTVGELCVLPPDVKKGIISTNLMKISLNKEIINPYFFCYLFKGSQLLLNKLNELCKGSTRLFLTQKILKALPFLLPPLKEQNRIVEKVDQLMTLCDELEQTVEQSKLESENLMKAVLQEALTVKEEVLN